MTDDLNILTADLAEAKADLVQWERLSSSADRVKNLAAAWDKAKAANDKAAAAEARAVTEARFDGLSNLRVTRRGHPGGGIADNILQMGWDITWTGQLYDMYAQTAFPKTFNRDTFQSLPDNVLAFLLERHPEQVPAEIMALSLDDPAEALYKYKLAKRRGYMSADAA